MGHPTITGARILAVFLIIVLVVILLALAYASRAVFHEAKRIYPNRLSVYETFCAGDVHGRIYHNNVSYGREDSHLATLGIIRGDEPAPIMMYCHGNTGNISQRSYVVEICKILGWDLVLFDYRGYGESPGEATTKGILQDGLWVYDWVIENRAPCQVLLWGESLGGGVAAYVASKRDCAGLVMFSTYSSLKDVVEYSPNYSGMVRACMSNLLVGAVGDIPSKKFLQKVSCPVTIVHSRHDTFIDFANAEDNLQHCPDGRLVPIEGDHAQPHMTCQQIAEIMTGLPPAFRREPTREQCRRICHILRHAARNNKLAIGTSSGESGVVLPLRTPRDSQGRCSSGSSN